MIYIILSYMTAVMLLFALWARVFVNYKKLYNRFLAERAAGGLADER